MAQASNNNVVNLGSHPLTQARLSPRESADVLAGCRDLALERLSSAMSGMLDKVEDELFTLAENCRDRAAQNLYLDARAKARGKRKLFETSFRQFFVDLFNEKVRGSRAGSHDLSHDQLSLVDDDQLDESIAGDRPHLALEGHGDTELVVQHVEEPVVAPRPGLDRQYEIARVLGGGPHLDDPGLHVSLEGREPERRRCHVDHLHRTGNRSGRRRVHLQR